MIADAYRYAESGGEVPREIKLANYIGRFGAQAVFGRTLGLGEMRRISAAENVYNAYKSRENNKDKDGNANWAKWAEMNPDMNRLLEMGAVLNGEHD